MMIRLKPLLVIAFAVVTLAVAASDSHLLADNLCVGKKDGNYALGICSADYMSCNNGTFSAHSCESGHYFDRANEQCSDRKAVAECQAPFDCSDRGDGIYSEGCSQNFWYCYGGSVAKGSCPPELYFNSETNMCEHSKSIKACKGNVVEGSGEETDVELGETRSMSRVDSDDSDQILTAVMRSSGGDLPHLDQSKLLLNTRKTGSVESMVSTFCLNRSDGNFFVSCDTKFIKCVNHVATVMYCSNGLVFSEDTNACSFVDAVPACANGAMKADIPRIPNSINDSLMSADKFASNPSKTSRQLDSICVKDRDSSPLFGLSSCSPYFFACKNSAVIIASCDEHFLFNKDTLRCETPYETFCPEKVPADAEKICETVGDIPVVETPPIEGACPKHSVRVFKECANSYYVCDQQNWLRHDCPDGLTFDSVVGACVSNCNSLKYVKKHLGSSTEEFCKEQGPGKHGLGCTSVYVDCSSNSVIQCEDGLVFNKFIQGCALYCEDAPASKLKIIDSIDYRNFWTGLFCAAVGNGLRTTGCSRSYFDCFEGAGTREECPQNLVFNWRTNKCAKRCARVSKTHLKTFRRSETDYRCSAGFTDYPTYHSNSQCSDVFFYCDKNGVAYKQTCPVGRYFNVYLRVCALSCDAPTKAIIHDADGLVKDKSPAKPTTKTFSSYQEIRQFRQQVPSTFITDGFSQNPVYMLGASRPLQTDQFAGIPEALPVSAPFTPNNVPGGVGFEAFDRGNSSEKPRVVHSPFPRFSDIRPSNTTLNLTSLPVGGVPPLQPRPFNIIGSSAKPLPIISDSAKTIDLLNGNDTSHANESAEVPTANVSFEDSGISDEEDINSDEEDIEPETTSLWRKKRKITTRCQYKQRWYNPNIAYIEHYEFIPQVECAAGKTPLGCTSGYIECVDGVPQVFSCPDNFIYDKQASRCIINNNTKCTLGLTVLDSKLPRDPTATTNAQSTNCMYQSRNAYGRAL